VDSSISGADEELCDLQCGKGSLDDVGNAVAKSGDGVVGVLEPC
jgi:hypothetical protein